METTSSNKTFEPVFMVLLLRFVWRNSCMLQTQDVFLFETYFDFCHPCLQFVGKIARIGYNHSCNSIYHFRRPFRAMLYSQTQTKKEKAQLLNEKAGHRWSEYC